MGLSLKRPDLQEYRLSEATVLYSFSPEMYNLGRQTNYWQVLYKVEGMFANTQGIRISSITGLFFSLHCIIYVMNGIHPSR